MNNYEYLSDLFRKRQKNTYWKAKLSPTEHEFVAIDMYNLSSFSKFVINDIWHYLHQNNAIFFFILNINSETIL